jgi:hypothetical protein
MDIRDVPVGRRTPRPADARIVTSGLAAVRPGPGGASTGSISPSNPSGPAGATARAAADPLAPIGLAVFVTVIAFLVDYERRAPWYVGQIPIPWSVLSAVLVLVTLAERSRRRDDRAPGSATAAEGPLAGFTRMTLGRLSDWYAFYAVTGVLLVAATVAYRHHVGSWTEPFAVLANGVAEEATFRYAIPLLVGGACVILGASRLAVPAGVTVSVVLFATMPGHLDQISRPIELAPFIAFAVLTTLVALRTGALLPGMLAHTLTNLCTLPVTLGVAAASWRVFGVLAALLGLVVAAEHAIRVEARRRAVAAVGPEPATAVAVVGPVIDLDFEATVAPVFEPAPRPLAPPLEPIDPAGARTPR